MRDPPSEPGGETIIADGEELPDEAVNTLVDIHDSLASPRRWQQQDVLLLANTRYLRGRTMTSCPCRRSNISRFGWLKSGAAPGG